MKLDLKRSTFLVCFLMLTTFLYVLGAQEKTITGKIRCVSQSEDEVSCNGQASRYSLVTVSGKQYFFMPEDSKSKVFSDSRVRDRKLQIKVWDHEEGQVEILKVFSIKDGQKYEIQYFCSVCNITAYVGGACWCCQQEFEFREVLVE